MRVLSIPSLVCALVVSSTQPGCSSSHGDDAGPPPDGTVADASRRGADGGTVIDAGESPDAGGAEGPDAGPVAGTVQVRVTREQVPVADALVWSRLAMTRTDAEGGATIDVAAIDDVTVMADHVDPPSPALRQLRTWAGVAPGDVLAFELGSAGPIRPRTTLRLDLSVPSPPATGEPDLPYQLYFCGGQREIQPTPGPVEVVIDPDCDVAAGVELLLANPTSAQETLHTRTAAPSGGAVEWDPGAGWVLATEPITVSVVGLPSDASFSTLRAVPLAGPPEMGPWISRGVSVAVDGDVTVSLPTWASHVALSFELLGFERWATRALAPQAISAALELDLSTVIPYPTSASVTVEDDGTLRGTWSGIDERADVIVLALDLEDRAGGVPAPTFNWQIMIDPRASAVGPLRVPAGSWLGEAAPRLRHIIVVDEDSWEGFEDARAAMSSADWYLGHHPGTWSLDVFDLSLE